MSIPIKAGITFRWKDYRRRGADRTLAPTEFMRRLLLHVLPDRFHRIRYYGLFANGQRAANFERCRNLLALAVAARKTAALTSRRKPTTALGSVRLSRLRRTHDRY